jgi:hypothetical protein
MKVETLRALRAIDWDFAVPRSGYVAPPHWYPGTFIPALSDALIEALTPVGGAVFDPYGGIGTTGWSALRLARSCHVADVNPIALLTSYATTSLLALARTNPGYAHEALGSLGRLIGKNDDLFGSGDPQGVQRLDEMVLLTCFPHPTMLLKRVVAGPPVWEALRQWFATETLTAFEALFAALAQVDSTYIRLLGLCMISAIARSVSSQHASWGHIADNVRPRGLTHKNVHVAITRWLKRAKAFVTQPLLEVGSTKPPHTTIHSRDWSKPTEAGETNLDLLLTSPPYADAIDYTLAQRLSLYLLGYNDQSILNLVAGEIGARRKRFKKTSRSEWSEQLCAALSDQVTWLKPEGSIVLLLPHKDSGRSAGEEDLKKCLDQLGWRLFFERDRSIHQSYTRQSWTSIKQETILGFTRN